jgi:hypothetical protein
VGGGGVWGGGFPPPKQHPRKGERASVFDLLILRILIILDYYFAVFEITSDATESQIDPKIGLKNQLWNLC